MKFFKHVALLRSLSLSLFILGCAGGEVPHSENEAGKHEQGATQADSGTNDGVEAASSEDGTEEKSTSPSDDSTSNTEEATSGGLDCSMNAGICESPFECLEGTCRIPIASLQEAEVAFAFQHPEELGEFMTLFKRFLPNLKLFALQVGEVSALSGRFNGVYGSADIINSDPPLLSWQRPEEPEYVFFSPNLGERGSDDGREWISDTFVYKLRARAQIEIANIDTSADLNVDILDAVLTHRQSVNDDHSVAQLTGTLTRVEAEQREFGSHEELQFVMHNMVCRIRDYVPSAQSNGQVIWHLSDVLDCSEAEMDVDHNGDLVMDAYQVELAMRLDSVNFQ